MIFLGGESTMFCIVPKVIFSYFHGKKLEIKIYLVAEIKIARDIKINVSGKILE
jgi:hypothetical protein